ncbi:PREDICTED: cytosolic endo-beta-N-acetylglucosaminidase-like [Branchiostoma belcheri]|uniref:mannosyl-glycoprotein endo-beta-N-acetylglucosaminidase n=1 Tax=Branchiostoma belcheri TaxID=7741 RepID=A0A6P4ZRJ1_BRABE|nr:PREDICTED: cytosolic endo-beta-N-acetylglucosaminidase-like [Branchiostoma belcheri]
MSGGTVSVSLADLDFSIKPQLGKNFETESDTSDSLVPVSRPLYTVEDVLAWTPHKDGCKTDAFNIATVPLAKRTQQDGVPKTLVCHDMKGGYIEDRFVQGTWRDDCYLISHWQHIDTFVYFSHHFITLPPPGWTNAAHKHGVKVLGTLITEWDDGAKRCQQFLKDQVSCRGLADKLAQMAQHYNFDGWLINIENPLEAPQVKTLVGFVSYLTEVMHTAVQGSEVIWYDSVITTGELKWQDELNDKNRIFFDSCDGIFLNYTWKEDGLQRSVEMAGERQHDVYVGVDVFGRNCYGGGGFNSNKALSVIRKQGLSAAVFAPGWVLEKLGADNFSTNQNKFWDLLSDLCPMHGPAALPFVTSFCQGQGQNFYINGQVARRGPWYNLSCQQVQTTFTSAQFSQGKDQTGENRTMRVCTKDAFHGGGSLLLGGNFAHACDALSFRLFSSEIPVQSPLLVSYTFKWETGADHAAVHLILRTTGQTKQWVLMEGDGDTIDKTSIRNNTGDNSTDQAVYFIALPEKECDRLYKECFGCTREETAEQGWWTRFYMLTDDTGTECMIEGINLQYSRTGTVEGDTEEVCLRLGEIRIMNAGDLEKNQKSTITNVTCRDVSWKKSPHLTATTPAGDSMAAKTVLFSATLQWEYPQVSSSSFDVYFWYKGAAGNTTDKVYVGRAQNSMYRVVDLPVIHDEADPGNSIEFIVYPIQ